MLGNTILIGGRRMEMATLQPAAPLTDRELISLAHQISKDAHEGQKYGSGGDYFTAHVCQVVLELYNSGAIDALTIAMAYLHDVIEDTETDKNDLIEAGIPEVVADGVELLSKISGECEFEYLLKLAVDQRALEVKIADATVNARGGRPKYKITLPLLKALRAGTLRAVSSVG